MDDMLSVYWNLLNETSNVVVLEWGFNLIIGMENVSFHIVGISIIIFLSLVSYIVICSCNLNFFPLDCQCCSKVMFQNNSHS
jgi:hypothetical protein